MILVLRPGDGQGPGIHVPGPDGRLHLVLWDGVPEDGVPEDGDVVLGESGDEVQTAKIDALGIRVLKECPDLEALIRWRDSLALDSRGDELVAKVMDLARRDDQRMPELLRPALLAFRALSYDRRDAVTRHVLGEYGNDEYPWGPGG